MFQTTNQILYLCRTSHRPKLCSSPLQLEDAEPLRRLRRGREAVGVGVPAPGKSRGSWKSMGNPWEIHGKTIENPLEICRTYGKYVGKSLGKIRRKYKKMMVNTWEIHNNIWAIHWKDMGNIGKYVGNDGQLNMGVLGRCKTRRSATTSWVWPFFSSFHSHGGTQSRWFIRENPIIKHH